MDDLELLAYKTPATVVLARCDEFGAAKLKGDAAKAPDLRDQVHAGDDLARFAVLDQGEIARPQQWVPVRHEIPRQIADVVDLGDAVMDGMVKLGQGLGIGSCREAKDEIIAQSRGRLLRGFGVLFMMIFVGVR